jgi:hypothetical protein
VSKLLNSTLTLPTSLNAIRGWIISWASRQNDGRLGLSPPEDGDGNCIIRIGRSCPGRVTGLSGKQPPSDLSGAERHFWILANGLGDEWDGLGIKLPKLGVERTELHIVNAARETNEILPYSRRFLSDLADTWPESLAALRSLLNPNQIDKLQLSPVVTNQSGTSLQTGPSTANETNALSQTPRRDNGLTIFPSNEVYVPTRPSHFRRWVLVWEMIKPGVGRLTYDKMYAHVKSKSKDLAATCGVDTLPKIVKAGVAGRLDRSV